MYCQLVLLHSLTWPLLTAIIMSYSVTEAIASIYSQPSAGRSCSSLASNSTSCSSQSSPTSHLYGNETTSTTRLVAKSSLSYRIALARERKISSEQEASVCQDDAYTINTSTTTITCKQTKKEMLYSRFFRKEQQWKREACVDQDTRIIQGLQSLGL